MSTRAVIASASGMACVPEKHMSPAAISNAFEYNLTNCSFTKRCGGGWKAQMQKHHL